jgi:hypothetical protein
MFINIQCPKCGAQSGFSLHESTYQGPYKCWKCREFCKIKLENNQLVSCEPMSQAEVDQMQKEKEAKDKAKPR